MQLQLHRSDQTVAPAPLAQVLCAAMHQRTVVCVYPEMFCKARPALARTEHATELLSIHQANPPSSLAQTRSQAET